MSRIAARLRPSQSVGDTIRAQTDLGTLWMTGGGLRFLEPQLPEDTDFSRAGNQLTFLKTSKIADWDDVKRGGDFVVATRSGRLFTWGFSANFRTGLDTTAQVFVPTEPVPATGPSTGWTAVGPGSSHCMAIRDGELFAWGSNAEGRTGLGTDAGDTPVPTKVEGFDDWVEVAGGLSHSLGVRANGTLYAWGRNVSFQTGLGTAVGNELTPVQVGTDTDWMTVSCGSAHSLALKQDGTAWSWGFNGSGRTGQGTTAGSTEVPTQVGTSTGWTVISAGSTHSMGIEDGIIVTCGSNVNGRTGRATTFGTVVAFLPVNTTNLTGDPIDVRAQETHSVALTTDGVWTCGSNATGRTGQDTTSGNTTVFTLAPGPIRDYVGSFDRIVGGFNGDAFNSTVLQRKKV